MDRFITIGEHYLINLSEVRKIRQAGNVIYIHYKNPEITRDEINFPSTEDAKHEMRGIPMSIRQAYAPLQKDPTYRPYGSIQSESGTLPF